MATWLADLKNRSLATRAGMLVLVVLVLYALAAPVAWHLGGSTGVWAASAAAGLCFCGAVLALVIAHLFRAPQHVLYGMLLGMAPRMGIPLGFGLAYHFYGGGLAEAGLLYYLLVFYPITLGVETVLSLPQTDCSPCRAEPSQDVS